MSSVDAELGSSVDPEPGSSGNNEVESEMWLLIEELTKFHQNWIENTAVDTKYPFPIMLSGFENCSFLRQFQNLSIRLSSLLPDVSISGLSDIDDILHQPIINQPSHSNILSGNRTSDQIVNCFDIYWYIITAEKFIDPLCISTFMQLIVLFVDSSFLEIRSHRLIALMLVPKYFTMANIKDVCLALKLMRVASEKCTRINKKYFYDDYSKGFKQYDFRDVSLWLKKLKNLNETTSVEGKERIFTWITLQASALLDFLDSIFTPVEHKFFSSKDDQESYVCNLILHVNGFVQMDYLYSYFMNSKDENERDQRIESFVRGCVKASGEIQTSTLNDDLGSAFTPTLWPEENENYPNNWEEIENFPGHRLEPYSTDCKKSINEGSIENVATLQYTFYEGFINHLQLMRILHKAFWMAAEILEIDRFPESYEMMVFRSSETSKYSRSFKYNLRNIWFLANRKWFEVTLKFCPFLLLSKHHEYLTCEFLKNYDQVEQASLEEIYFALHWVPEYK